MTPAGRARPGRGLRPCLAVLTLLAALSCAGHSSTAARPRTPVHLRLPALDGGEIDLARYRGRVVVLHAFTTWSMASQADVEQLVSAHDAHPDDVTVVGLALDPDGYRLVAPWRHAMRVPYLVTLATDAVRGGQSAIGRIGEVPTTVVLDRVGVEAVRVNGPLAPRQLRAILADLLPTE